MEYLVGIDLAWRGGKNTSAISIAEIHKGWLNVVKAYSAISTWNGLIEIVRDLDNVLGIAIDAPLIIKDSSGMRGCERDISAKYAARGAGCHAANLTLYPDADSVKLSVALSKLGFDHLNSTGMYQIEVYPHPALIELFELPYRHLYKKGHVAIRREGQVKLAGMIKSLQQCSTLPLHASDTVSGILNAQHILSLRGRGLKQNEDALDSIICVYIAGLYNKGLTWTFGNGDEGYIVVPTINYQ